MLTDSLRLSARAIETNDRPKGHAEAGFELLDWGTGDRLLDALRLLGQVVAQDANLTSCSPVIPTGELTRIRNNVVDQFSTLRNSYSNIGSSLDSTGLAAQHRAVFDAMEGGSYCHYAGDAHLVRDIQDAAQGANQVLANAFNQFASNFSGRMLPVRSSYAQLQSASSNATTSVEPVLNAYKSVWANNFTWKLHQGINTSLDNLIAEYKRLFNGSRPLFDQGISRVQGAFEAAVRQSNEVYAGFSRAFTHWDTVDGATGYGMYVDNVRMYDDELKRVSQFTVLDDQRNQQIFAEVRQRIADVRAQFSKFPNFIAAQPSVGFALDPGTSSLKFYSRQLTLNIAQGAGAHFNSTIAAGSSLIGTGFSFQHGGRMPPHAEHKDGRDCDILSVYFRVGGAEYNEEKAVAMATWLLQAGVSRLIYTNAAVVAAANAAVPGHAVAVVGSGHETHIHFDVNHAT